MMKSEGRDVCTVLKFNDMGDFEGTYRVAKRALLAGRLARNRTSCEAKNLFLDGALIVDTVGQTGAGFF
jgi:hypothetical protein